MAGETQFIAGVMGVAAVVLGYADFRRVLHAAVDDRYGEWSRFRGRAGGSARLRYALAFFFAYGARDLWVVFRLLLFDLFVVFALLSPYWHALYFEDWNLTLAGAVSVAGAAVYMGWELRRSLALCRVHAWSEQTGCCEKCGCEKWGETRAAERPAAKKGGKQAPPAKTRHGWHGFWAQRLERLAERQPESPRPAG
ncbi:MAG: hypothetical protein HY238_10125 [Acidobacteria bacterium]|nr:hypothetical protein [Acidobacteriota bacterium]